MVLLYPQAVKWSALNLLTIDIGNSFVKAGIWRRETLIGGQPLRLPTHPEGAPGTLAERLRRAVREDREAELGDALKSVEAVVIASVVPALTPLWAAFAREQTGNAPLVVTAQTDTGIKSRYQTQATLGADRWVNAFAAHALLGPDTKSERACIVVDFGTATKWEAVAPGGLYLGGAIAPGVGTGRDALFARAAQLSGVPLALAPPVPVIGSNTEAALQAGILRGNAAQSDGIIASMMQEMNVSPANCVVWATGGLAGLIIPHCQMDILHAPHLTLDGLRLLHKHSVRQEKHRADAR